MIKKIMLGTLTSSILLAGVYLVPQEYDNVVASSRSFSYGLINQATSDVSGNSYTLGGVVTQYKCLKIPKISCVASTVGINANISEASLKKPVTEALMDVFQLDLRIEDDANNWYVCGGGYGGSVWDDTALTSSNVAGVTQVNYNYTPNSKIEEFYYFTNVANTSTKSYLAVTYNQTCN